jgi:glycine cleavage system H protein
MAYVLGMSTFPDDLRYTETHQWVRDGQPLATLGITQTEADRLGPITFVELPYPGELLQAGKVLCRISGEANSAVLKMAFTAKVMTTNPILADQPGLVSSDPYGAGWIVKLEPGAREDIEGLMDAAAYEASLSGDDA